MTTPVPFALQRAHAHGVTVVVTGEDLRLVTPAKPPDAILEALRADKADVVAYLKIALAMPPDPAATPPHLIGEYWRQHAARLDPAHDPCPGFGRGEWPRVYRTIADFLNPAAPFARIAAEQHCTTLKLFGVHKKVGARRVDVCGALLVSMGSPVTAVSQTTIRFANGLGTACLALDPSTSIAVWDFGEPTP
jgi:hypothetical protein